MDRPAIFNSIKQNQTVSVLIIGGGINGVGTFRDLALNGVDTLLIDRGDFCSGASAASSHMAHGGIRYLENGEFRLVREAVIERNYMIQNAPHIVRPLATTIPIFKIWSGLLNAPLKFLGWLNKPAERGAIIIKLGLILYDAFTQASQRTVPTHRFNSRSASLSKFPDLHPEVRYTATYFDGSILSPERYTMELILDAELEGPHAKALNYTSLIRNGRNHISLRDEISGSTYELTPKIIVNAAGPWIDQVNNDLGFASRYIHGTKGSHLVLDNPDLRGAIGEHEFFFENEDGRIVLIFPLLDKVIVGTSDIPTEDPDSAVCTEEEVDYFFGMIRRVFPNITLEREQIIFRFSGVRPLTYSKARTTGQITRDHSIEEDMIGDVPIYSLVGGKWTSYRAFSEQVTDKVLAFLGKKRIANTRQLAIGGGRNYEYEKNSQTRNNPLFARYGSRWIAISNHPGGKDTPLTHNPEMTQREVSYLAQEEKVVHLDDLILRRSLMAFLGQLKGPLLNELVGIIGDTLEWDETQKQAEITRTLTILRKRHNLFI